MHVLTEFGQEIFDSRYTLYPGESWDEACKRVATHVAMAERYDDVKSVRDEFYNVLIDNLFMPAGRIWAGAGRPKANLLNCFVLPPTEDSREGWGQAIKDVIIIAGMGGGVGLNCSDIRPHGDPIKGTGGTAGGPLAFMEILNSMGEVIRASGGRRMALLLGMQLNHPDIMDFIKAKSDHNKLNNANVSVMIPPNGAGTDFYKAVKKDGDYPLVWGDRVRSTIKAKELWQTIVTNAITTAEPGIINLHLMNKMNNLWWCKPIVCTNPCLTGDQRLLTVDGYKTLRELWETGGNREFEGFDKDYGKIEIVNSNGVVEATNVYRTSECADVYLVTLDDGTEIKATENHKFFVLDEDGNKQKCELKDLEVGDEIPLWDGMTEAFGKYHNPDYALLSGWVTGDGHLSYHKSGQLKANITIYNDDISEVMPVLQVALKSMYNKYNQSSNQSPEYDGVIYEPKGFNLKKKLLHSLVLGRLMKEDGLDAGNKHKVPNQIWSGDKYTVAAYLRGLFSADGYVNISNYKKSISIRLSQNSKSLLLECKQLLGLFSIKSSVLKRRDAHKKIMNDGKGGMKEYNCQEQYELIISGIKNCSRFMDDVGFMQQSKNSKARDWLIEHKGSNNSSVQWFSKIKSINSIGQEETFCLTEPVNNEIVIRGGIVSQCGEQSLEAYGACDLGSIVLPKFVKDGKLDWDKLAAVVKTSVRFLDNTIDVTNYPLSEIENNVKQARRVGLGVTGVHDVLILLGLKYDYKGIDFVEKLMMFIRDEAYKASCDLAAKKGSFPLYVHSKYMESEFIKELPPHIKGMITQKGIRNATLLTIAPTGTTSIVCGTSSGIEPIFSLGFKRTIKTEKGKEERFVVHPLIEEMQLDGKDVKGIQTTHDIDVRVHLEMQKVCQKYVDSSISKTINLPSKVLKDKAMQAEISDLLLEYIPYLKGVTVYADGCRGDAPIQSMTIEDVIKASGCKSGTCGT